LPIYKSKVFVSEGLTDMVRKSISIFIMAIFLCTNTLFAYDKIPLYFVELGAYKDYQSARKASLATDFPTKIVYLEQYYTLLSNPSSSIQEAKTKLQKIQKKFYNARIIKLNKKSAQKLQIIKGDSSLFKQAYKNYQHKKYEDALALFDRILILDPEDYEAKFYYALTLSKLGFLDESLKTFAQLQKASIPQSLQQRIQPYLCAISKKRDKHFFHFTLTYGAGYNDNINLTTDKKFTDYGPYRLQNDTNKTKSSYAIAAFELSHRYKGLDYELFNKLYSYNELLHSAKGDDLNYIDISSTFMKKWRYFTLLLPVGYNSVYLDSSPVGYNYYTHPTLIHKTTTKIDTTLQINITDNHTKYAPKRDYRILGGGMGIRYHDNKVTSFANLSYDHYAKKESGRYDISKNVTESVIQAEYQFYQKLYIGANLTYSYHYYTDLDPVMGYKREDKRTIYSLWLAKELDKNTLVKTKYQHTFNDSNVNLYSYHKNNYTLEYKHIF
jgi:hypothetical protein